MRTTDVLNRLKKFWLSITLVANKSLTFFLRLFKILINCWGWQNVWSSLKCSLTEQLITSCQTIKFYLVRRQPNSRNWSGCFNGFFIPRLQASHRLINARFWILEELLKLEAGLQFDVVSYHLSLVTFKGLDIQTFNKELKQNRSGPPSTCLLSLTAKVEYKYFLMRFLFLHLLTLHLILLLSAWPTILCADCCCL